MEFISKSFIFKINVPPPVKPSPATGHQFIAKSFDDFLAALERLSQSNMETYSGNNNLPLQSGTVVYN